MTSQTQQLESDKIHLMLLLEGGEQCEISLPSADNPFLQELFQTILARSSQNRNYGRLFKIPMDEGHSALYIPSDSILGIATDPPMVVDANGLVVKQFQQVELPSTYQQGAQFIQIDNFLEPEQHQRLLEHVMAKEAEMIDSATDGGAADARKSKVICLFRGKFADLIKQKIAMVMPNIVGKLGLSIFEASQIESQLTAHNEGHYYQVHNDNTSPETAGRQLTYVYYFNREPKAFTGGNLRLYDSKITNGFWDKADSFKDIEPRNNSIVFFFSGYWHEVMPVICTSQDFADSRFTINGWVWR